MSQRTDPLGLLSAATGVAVAAWLSWTALSLRLPPPPVAASGGASLAAPPALAPCVMTPDGYWRGRIFAASELAIDWQGAGLDCAGNARPGDAGLRLFFAGHPAGSPERLMLIIGIAAKLDGLAGTEQPASVTLIDEATSEFFNSPGGRCFTRVREVSLLDGKRYRVEGDLYCVGAIAAVTGPGSVTIGDTSYAGIVTLEEP